MCDMLLSRTVLVPLLKRPLWLALIFCVGCSAQSASPDVSKRIERQVRSHYNVPNSVQITVGAVKPSEFPNYDTVAITFDGAGRKNVQEFLLSKDGKSLLKMSRIDISPEAYEATLKRDVDTRQKQAELMKKIDIAGRPFRGAKDPKVSVVVYDDFQCPYCAEMYRTLFSDVMKTYGDRVRIVFKDYPLFQIHPWAKRAAIDANCLAEQSNDAYWDFADYVHANQKDVSGATRDVAVSQAKLDSSAVEAGKRHNVDAYILQTCLKTQPDAALNASVKEADSLGVQATPTLFINGEKLEGAVDVAEVRAVLDRALREAGQPPAAMANSSNPPPAAPQPADPKK
jgi:protein-disulfide isomerase